MSGAAADGTLFYEDLDYGAGFDAGPRAVSEEDLRSFADISGDHNRIHVDAEYAAATRFGRPLVHGPFGIAITMGLMHDLGILERSALALLDVEWSFRGPVFVGDELSLRMTVTSRRLARNRETGIVGRHLRLTNQAGKVVQEGTMGLMIKVGDVDRAVVLDAERPAPGTLHWGRRLAERLNEDGDFALAAKAFDGVVGLRFGKAELALKVFEGGVLKVAPRFPQGATFTIAAAEIDWLDFFRRERNEFMAMTSRGRFTASGNLYEYMRLTRALTRLLDQARSIS